MHILFNHSFNGIIELRHLLSVLIACACGWAIGYERKARNKQAGVKTHVIVALTSALMMILSKEAFLDTPEYDTSRVAAQIVSGISFIGGGIIFTRDKKISGITTAAGIWATAGIGMAIGAGFWIFGSLCSAIVVLVQLITHGNGKNHTIYQAKILATTSSLTLANRIYARCNEQNYQKTHVEVRAANEQYEVQISIENDKEISATEIENLLSYEEESLQIKELKLKRHLK